MRIKKIGFFFLLMLIIIPQMGCSGEEPVYRSSFYFNTPCTITIYEMESEAAGELITEAFSICADLESKLSKTVEGSDVSCINESKGQPTKVSGETIEVLKKGLYYSALSEGVFDITVGRLTELWDFQEERKVPEEAEIRAGIDTVGYENLMIEEPFVTLTRPEAKIDIGGIGKGYAADQITAFLKANGVEKAIINFGGNIVTMGEKAEGVPWEVGLDKPFSDRSEIVGTMKTVDQTVVTSGVYERFFEENGVLYHHILNPETGKPVESNLDSVTIVGPAGTSADCDALSTICFLLGEEKGKALLESMEGLEGVFFRKDGTFSQTSGMNFVPLET